MLIATAVTGLAVAGCGSGSSTGSGMMGGGGSSTSMAGDWGDRRRRMSLRAGEVLATAIIAGQHR